MVEKVKLSKYMTREHSIFYASVWDEANRNHWDKYFLAKNIKNMVFLVDKEKMLTVYYDLSELEATLKEVGDGVVKNPEIVDKILEDFNHYTEIMKPYFTGEKKIQDLEELKTYRENWIKWWWGVEHFFVIPNEMQVPEEIRERVLKVREETQVYSDSDDKVYMNFIKEKYPMFSKYAHVLKPDEVYRIEELTEEETRGIEERLNGCMLVTANGESVFLQGEDINKQLSEKGIILEDSPMNIKFQKNYTRDTAMFLQDIWARDQSIILPKLLGKENPCLPGIIHHVKNGSVEIWENEKATQWLLDTVLEKNISDPSFFSSEMEKYKVVLEDLKKFWNKGTLQTVAELKELAILIEKGVNGFNFFYRTAFDDRTPKDLRELALEIRKDDVFFSQNDILIHTSISNIFPHLKGYENYIFADELDNLPSVEVLNQRKNGFVVVDGTEHFIGDLSQHSEIHPSLEFETEEIDENIKELKGQVGYKGLVRGAVKLIFRREQVGEIKEGEILVSPMTTPDFLSAMHKAAAFVTDEGGITCHAAIVAREMKKPCVIGTKIATQVLKDGMEVEVDAEKGVIRILG